MIHEQPPDEKAQRIRKAVFDALVDNDATNQHAFDALSVNLVILLRKYQPRQREAHLDMFYTRVVSALFDTCLKMTPEDGR